MVSFPNAKINLGLNILRKRPDGYHDLETCFYPIPWSDVLEIIPSASFSFSSSGLTVPGDTTTNLCVRAYKLLQADFDLPPVQIHLHKVIPMGAGLGGGSADGAFVLKQLNEKFELNLSERSLVEYASRLGSDCAFFIHNSPMLGTGRGEILKPVSLSLKGKFLLVVKPDIHVSTAEAFAGIKPHVPTSSISEIIVNKTIQHWRNLLTNDFEQTIFPKHPSIQQLKEKLYNHGALYASMSGSGSSVFGIFDRIVDAPFTSNASTIIWQGLLPY